MTALLPPGFEVLEPFVSRWAGATTAERAHLRAAEQTDREAFHKACAPLLQQGLEMLDRKPISQLDEQERRLLNMFLSFAHVVLAVEVQGSDEEKHRPLREAMTITRATADFNTS